MKSIYRRNFLYIRFFLAVLVLLLFFSSASLGRHINLSGHKWNSVKSIWLMQLNHSSVPLKTSEDVFTHENLEKLKSFQIFSEIYAITMESKTFFLGISSDYSTENFKKVSRFLDEKNRYFGFDESELVLQIAVRPLTEVEDNLGVLRYSNKSDEFRLSEIVAKVHEKIRKNGQFHIYDTINPDTTILYKQRIFTEELLEDIKQIDQNSDVLDVFLSGFVVPSVSIITDSVRSSRFGLLSNDVNSKVQKILLQPFSGMVNYNDNFYSSTREPITIDTIKKVPFHFFNGVDVFLDSFAKLSKENKRFSKFFPLNPSVSIKQDDEDIQEAPSLKIILRPDASSFRAINEVEGILGKKSELELSKYFAMNFWNLYGGVCFILFLVLLAGHLNHLSLFAFASIFLSSMGNLTSFVVDRNSLVIVFGIGFAYIFSVIKESRTPKKNIRVGIFGKMTSSKVFLLISLSSLTYVWIIPDSVFEFRSAFLLFLISISILVSEFVVRDNARLSENQKNEFGVKDVVKSKRFDYKFKVFCFGCLFIALLFFGLIKKNRTFIFYNRDYSYEDKDIGKSYGSLEKRELIFSNTQEGLIPGHERYLRDALFGFREQFIDWVDIDKTQRMLFVKEKAISDLENVDLAYAAASQWADSVITYNHENQSIPLSRYVSVGVQSSPYLSLITKDGYGFFRDAEENFASRIMHSQSKTGNDQLRVVSDDFDMSRFLVSIPIFSIVCFLYCGLFFGNLREGFRFIYLFTSSIFFVSVAAFSFGALVSFVGYHFLPSVEMIFLNSCIFASMEMNLSQYLDANRLSARTSENFVEYFLSFPRNYIAFLLFGIVIGLFLMFWKIDILEFILLFFECLLFMSTLNLFLYKSFRYAEEILNRHALKYILMHAKTLFFLFFISSSLSLTFRAEASGNVTSTLSTCNDTITVIFPFYGRPKGSEPPVSKTIFTERLNQEIPCSFINLEKNEELLKIHDDESIKSQAEILKKIQNFLIQQNSESLEPALRFFPKMKNNSALKLRVLGGYFEEFFGSVSFTLIEVQNNALVGVFKEWYAAGEDVEGVAKLAKRLKNNTGFFVEDFIQKHKRIPVYIRSVESLDKNLVSENLANEIEVFLKSKLHYPASKFVFQRKSFFTDSPSFEESKYIADLRIRQEGVRLFASGTVESKSSFARRSFWVESDISNIQTFAQTVYDTMESDLSTLDGIFNYSIVFGPEFWFYKNYKNRFFGLEFRQNMGNLAFSLRAKSGNIDGDRTVKSAMLGALAGWQFVDWRWMSADCGLSFDFGSFGETYSKLFFERSFIASYGVYVQGQFLLYKNYALLARYGNEKPIQISVDKQTTKLNLPKYSQTLFLGLGLAF